MLFFSQKSLSVAHFIPDKTKKTMGKERPLCVATDNGIALPCSYFVLAGIAWAAQREEETE